MSIGLLKDILYPAQVGASARKDDRLGVALLADAQQVGIVFPPVASLLATGVHMMDIRIGRVLAVPDLTDGAQAVISLDCQQDLTSPIFF